MHIIKSTPEKTKQEKAQDRFEEIKKVLQKGSTHSDQRRALLAEIAVLRELNLITSREALPYLK